jgi:hypothetical protein
MRTTENYLGFTVTDVDATKDADYADFLIEYDIPVTWTDVSDLTTKVCAFLHVDSNVEGRFIVFPDDSDHVLIVRFYK